MLFLVSNSFSNKAVKIIVDFKHEIENIKKLIHFKIMYNVNVLFYKLTKTKLICCSCFII